MSAAALVHRFDRRADAALERVRSRHHLLDRMFTAASHLGDFSVVWHLVGVTRWLTGGSTAAQAAVFSALIGLESLVVNQGVKRLFRRTRPTETGDPRFQVRRPRTSSFPSGHASSAFFAATVLVHWTGWSWAPLWIAMAAVVATSRAFVRIHHASDVVGGAVVGLALGQLALVGLRAWG